MSDTLLDIFRTHLAPLEPVPTGETAVLPELDGIEAVLFDIYGTLLISASGDVGATREAACGTALAGALEAVGVEPTGDVAEGVECYLQAIAAAHAKGHSEGVDFPEIDVVTLWPEVLGEMANRGVLEPSSIAAVDPRRFAVEYEVRANPCWPMPGVHECLAGLRRLPLGLVSNAQFYTPLMFEALLESPPEKWGIAPSLQFFSYEHGLAKPGTELFAMAAEELQTRGITAPQVLYVGNDMLNDIHPARQVGFRTGLFAGDARSLRWRKENSETKNLTPDLVLTDLLQIIQCIKL